MKLSNITRYIIYLSITIGLNGCINNTNLKSSKVYSENSKHLLGYYNNYPVFEVNGINSLLLLKNNKVLNFYSFNKGLLPKYVHDSMIVFADNNKIVIDSLGKSKNIFELDSPVFDIAFNTADSCLYFLNNYEKEIKRIDVKTGIIDILPFTGYFKAIQDNKLYYYNYSDKDEVSAFVDLMVVSLEQASKGKEIGSYLSEEFLTVSTDNKYVLTFDYSKKQNGTFIFCIDQASRKRLQKVPESYRDAYYDQEQERFVYFDMYTLDTINIEASCKK